MDDVEIFNNPEIKPLIAVLSELRAEEKLTIALLFGSFANGSYHRRSDIDLGIAIPLADHIAETKLMA